MSDDDEAMVSKEFHDRVVADLQSKILKMSKAHRQKVTELEEKLTVKAQADKQRILCPICERRVKYDAIEEEYVCLRDGWHGLSIDAIVED